MRRFSKRLAALEVAFTGAKPGGRPTVPARLIIQRVMLRPEAGKAIEKLRQAEGYGVDEAKAKRLRGAAQRSFVALARKLGETEIAETLEQG